MAADESDDVLTHSRSRDIRASCPAAIEDQSIDGLRMSCGPVDSYWHTK
jgi:hypothetical protein